MYVVILAGGGGTRLWPLSTPDRPKPFLPLLADGESLFQRTIRRLQGPELGDFDVGQDLYVIVDGRFKGLAQEQARDEAPGLPDDHVLAEPTGRNTAAAIALRHRHHRAQRRRRDGRAAGRPPDPCRQGRRVPRACSTPPTASWRGTSRASPMLW